MHLITLTQGLAAKVDDADYAALSLFKWYAMSCPTARTWYACRDQNRRRLWMHREILGAHSEVDHKNGDGLDNQRANLRLATRSQNMANRVLKRVSHTGFRGVYVARGNRFQAQIRVNKRIKSLGYFTAAEDAAEAYDTAARHYFGDFATTNFDALRARA